MVIVMIIYLLRIAIKEQVINISVSVYMIGTGKSADRFNWPNNRGVRIAWIKIFSRLQLMCIM